LCSRPRNASIPSGKLSPAANQCASVRGAETRDEVARIAFVPRRGEDDYRLALGGEPEDLVRYAERVEQKQAAPVVDCIRRKPLAPTAVPATSRDVLPASAKAPAVTRAQAPSYGRHPVYVLADYAAAMPSMTQLVLVDGQEREVGRCGVESWVTFTAGHSVDLGPVGYFRILDVRSGDPTVLVVAATKRVAPGARL
jgi:hypothetical protein